MVLRPSHPPLWEAAFGCLHASEAGAFGASSTGVASIMADGRAAKPCIAHLQTIPIPDHDTFFKFVSKNGKRYVMIATN